MKKYLGLFKQTISEFSGDKVPRLGAALAYYTIFSLAPLLLIVIAIAGIVFGHDAAQGKIFDELRTALGPTTAAGMQEMVRNAAKPKSGMVATILGVATLILGASGVFGQLKDALSYCDPVDSGALWNWYNVHLNNLVVRGAAPVRKFHVCPPIRQPS